jgi:hypothetical protein
LGGLFPFNSQLEARDSKHKPNLSYLKPHKTTTARQSLTAIALPEALPHYGCVTRTRTPLPCRLMCSVTAFVFVYMMLRYWLSGEVI